MSDRRDHDRAREQRDEGSVLVLVLVLMVVASLVVLPLMTYAMSVSRHSRVQQDKARAIELARGGLWVALHDPEQLFDCAALDSSLDGVSTTCTVLSTASRLPADAVPFSAAVVQADATLPVATSNAYTNPNTAADAAAWAYTPEWTAASSAGKVWIPDLPIPATSATGGRITDMKPGTQDPAYASCKVFFPGTFTTAIDITGPTYFTSGVYYFEQPITVHRGASVVVGGGSEIGCSTDFEAIADAVAPPNPLNISGLGGTFVFGGSARLVVDDGAGAGDIRFVMNQRYVGADEESVAASAGVSIVSVNGTHAPLVGAEALGNDLVVPGVIAVPASTVDDDADPSAITHGYHASTLTAKPVAPDAPGAMTVAEYKMPSGNNRVALVTWTAPGTNTGSPLTGYTVTASNGATCSHVERTSCVITGLPRNATYSFSLVAANGAGNSVAATASHTFPNSGSGLQSANVPAAPNALAVTATYTTAATVGWTPGADNHAPIDGFDVTATPASGAPLTCHADWDETSCTLSDLVPTTPYTIRATASNAMGTSSSSTPLAFTFDAGATAYVPPTPPVVTAGVRVPDPIVDLSMVSSAKVDISIAGYVAVPQGHVLISTNDGAAPQSVRFTGGLVAGQVRTGPTLPAKVYVDFDNPIAQKTLRIVSRTTGTSYEAVSDAVVQVNRSGTRAINSWIVQ